MIKPRGYTQGFTLIELMIVIAIVAILVALAVPADNAQGGVDWACSIGTTTAAVIKYLPSSCRGDNT